MNAGRALWWTARAALLAVCRVAFRVRVLGRGHVPPDGAYILAPSHRSILDVPFTAFATRRRICFLAKQELFQGRLGGALFPPLGGIPVERGSTDRAALRAADAVLVHGDPLAIFPEGTRRHGATLGDLFHGCAYLALRRGVPIVPVGIGGSEEILPSGHVVPRPHRVVVVIGAPLVAPPEATARRRSDVAALTERLRVELQAVFDEARERAGTAGLPAGEVREGA
ncbi:MAG TPA: lysophospholipid acyltransferase family protein [Acidimicrobiia bacterium]|jgi:1-acyl-sn-glycerol-3-phosphate acyltransferase|nr:lysophospholipid acyltransferase family protein [Acidimicrobiia bacterium]